MPKKQKSIYDYKTPCASWDFRLNESLYTLCELRDACSKLGKKWCFQLEEGDSTSYRHYQGRISLWKKKRGAELAKLWMMIGELPMFIRPTVEKEHQTGDAFYMMKLDTRVDGPWTNKDHVQYIPKQYQVDSLRTWQQTVVDSGNSFNARRVDCIVEQNGNKGKSVCSGFAHLHGHGLRIPPINDPQALIQAVMNMCMAKDTHAPGIIFIDLPRSQNKEKLAGLYNAIEQIKDGYLYDFRYQFKEWWIDSPRIWVFTNSKPNTAWLSSDRWKFWHIDDKVAGGLAPN